VTYVPADELAYMYGASYFEWNIFLEEVKKLTRYIQSSKGDMDSLDNSDKLEKFDLVQHDMFPRQSEMGRIYQDSLTISLEQKKNLNELIGELIRKALS
jgi:hypothetical protein